jgi:hypothetical protein
VPIRPLKSAPPFAYGRHLEAGQGKGRKREFDYYSDQGGSRKPDGYAYRSSIDHVSSQPKESALSPYNAGR